MSKMGLAFGQTLLQNIVNTSHREKNAEPFCIQRSTECFPEQLIRPDKRYHCHRMIMSIGISSVREVLLLHTDGKFFLERILIFRAGDGIGHSKTLH